MSAAERVRDLREGLRSRLVASFDATRELDHVADEVLDAYAAAVRAEERARLEEGLVGFQRIAFVAGAKWGATDRGMAQAHAEAVKRYPLAALTGADK